MGVRVQNATVQVVQLPLDRLPVIEPLVRDLCGGRRVLRVLVEVLPDSHQATGIEDGRSKIEDEAKAHLTPALSVSDGEHPTTLTRPPAALTRPCGPPSPIRWARGISRSRERGDERRGSEITTADGQAEILREVGHQQEMLAGIRADIAAMRKDVKALHRAKPAGTKPVTEGEARRVFGLMDALEPGPKERKAPLNEVFRLLVREGRTQKYAAVEFDCTASLISLRATEIERRTGRPVAELRLMATQLGNMEASVKDSRARMIYQKGLTDDTGDEDKDE